MSNTSNPNATKETMTRPTRPTTPSTPAARINPTPVWRPSASAAGSLLLLGAALTGCGAEGTGSLTVLLEAEDVITSGIEAGDGPENIRDGWTVTFDRYIAAVGALDIHRASNEDVDVDAPEVFVVDVAQVPATGLALFQLDGLRAGRWEFNYATPAADEDATRHASVSQADYDDMVANGWTYLIDGTLRNPSGQSCPPVALATPGAAVPNGNVSGTSPCYDAAEVRFVVGAAADTHYGPCRVDEVPGFAVTSGGSTTVAMTLHGDHIFFNGFPESTESGVTRLAQWLADCDLNLDGTVTAEELQAIAPSQLAELDERFQLGGSPITPLDTMSMYTYFRAQLKTQGHFQGEGECPVDGVGHVH